MIPAPTLIARSRTYCAAALSFGLANAAPADPPRYRVELFDPPLAQPSMFPLAMNENGAITGYASDDRFSPLGIPVLIEASGNVVTLGQPNESSTFPLGLDESGRIVGTSQFIPHLWIGDSITPLPITPGYGSASALDINNAGRIVGSVGDSDFVGPQHAVWINAANDPVILPGILANSTNGAAWAVNEAGRMAGVSGSQVGEFYAARWDAPDATPLQIGPLAGAMNSEGLDINAHGDVVGRSSFLTGETQAILYVEATSQLQGLGYLPGGGPYTFAWAVNDARQVVGDANAGSESHAFLWEDGTLHDLNDLLFQPHPLLEYLSSAVSINNAGQIAADAVIGVGPATAHVIARLTPVIPGDLDGDGDVDLSDLTLLLSSFGCSAPACVGDIDGDGDTDLSDLTLLLSNFGAGG